ncbi:hemerythrin domain-containing protein [Saccharicrinis fermentans]|uniref:Cell wall biosynthesis protein ScdA n=2 Tax=Saccharicrinis fermentans TaxID=982 RepID=W7XV12_9BACT|nr:hemerythrin domain-containing protein [Saccharicrinis fermentans]GAF01905.1 cell wall biosynthesis protein ScdA [Saccharicrinis fermentans DSM 9555 = JCM 21142]
MENGVFHSNLKNIKLLNDFFKEYTNELLHHLKKEDGEVFPYVINLEKCIQNKIRDEEISRVIKEESIEEYERGHDSLEVKLSDLKNLIIKFLPSVLCKELCQKLLTELFRLEKDLENHSRIEDKVLVPKVKMLEQKYLDIHGIAR